MKAVHIFTHTDADGKFSGSLMYEYFKRYRNDVDKYFIHPIDYTTIIDIDVKPEDVITFTDYSFSNNDNLEYFYNLIKDGHEVIWIDHHASSEKIIQTDTFLNYVACYYDIFTFIINTSHCAAWLTYEYLYYKIIDANILEPELPHITIPDIIKYVNSNDIWALDMPKTEEFSYGLSCINYTAKNAIRTMFNHNKDLDIFDYNKKVAHAELQFINNIISKGEIIKQYKDISNNLLRKSIGFKFTINDETTRKVYKCFAMNTQGNSRIFGDYINKYDIICSFYKTSNGVWKYSLFSSTNDKDGPDCSYIASIFGGIDRLGGGGHMKAAGFQTKECIFDNYNSFDIRRSLFSKKYCLYGFYKR